MNQIIKREFKFLADPRSGHHAIMWWIFDSFEEIKQYTNNCHPDNGIVIGTGSPSRIKDEKIINCAMFNIEGADISTVQNKPFFQKGYSFLMPQFTTVKSDIILVIRDIYNHMSSHIKHKGFNSFHKRIIKHYKQNVKQMLKIKNYMPQLKNINIINYNEWFGNNKYRQNIIDILNLTIDNTPYGNVCAAGAGSSFDKRKMNGKGNLMEVLTRYKYYENNKQYLEIFEKDKELIELTKIAFDIDPFNLS